MERRSLWFLVLLAAGALSLALAPGAQAASGPAYGLTASYSTSCTGDVVCISTTYDWSGSARCIGHCAGVPQSGSFTIHLSGGAPFFPPNPCLAKRVSGSFSATWSDATFTTSTVSGHTRDGKSYLIEGVVSESSTRFPPNPWKGSAAYPPNPVRPGCTAGTVSYPTDPIFIAFGS